MNYYKSLRPEQYDSYFSVLHPKGHCLWNQTSHREMIVVFTGPCSMGRLRALSSPLSEGDQCTSEQTAVWSKIKAGSFTSGHLLRTFHMWSLLLVPTKSNVITLLSNYQDLVPSKAEINLCLVCFIQSIIPNGQQ